MNCKNFKRSNINTTKNLVRLTFILRLIRKNFIQRTPTSTLLTTVTKTTKGLHHKELNNFVFED